MVLKCSNEWLLLAEYISIQNNIFISIAFIRKYKSGLEILIKFIFAIQV